MLLIPVNEPIVVIEPTDVTNHVWRTNYGKRIPVCEMSTSHIRNCLSAFAAGRIHHGYMGGKQKWDVIFNDELLRRQ